VCKQATCGDGFKQPGEECDAGANNSNTGACTLACKLPKCGDLFVQMGAGETCDDGNLSNADACLNTCKAAKCGDAFVQQGVEQCDDGNVSNLDACTNVCKTAACGDTFVQSPETCDDGNLVSTDACTGQCKPAACGDGFVQAGVEQCDDANMVNTDACTSMCKAAKCGDGIVQAGVEQCDDGNLVDNDQCTNACKTTQCVPTGQRASLNNLALDSASGCWSGNPCDNDGYDWNPADGQNFQAFGQAIACSGVSTCVANVGINTYASDAQVCQGKFDVYCDGVLAGTIDTLGKPCGGSAMGNGCKTSFTPRKCAAIELRAVNDGQNVLNCCNGTNPDSMITAVSAW
jgi:cysteine-rich repeat protein